MSGLDAAAGRWLIHRRLERRAARSGSAIAVASGADVCDYRTLLGRAGQLANYLRRHGIGAGDVVLVLLEKSVDVVVAAVAAWQIGAAYAPMDHRTPAARVRQVLDQIPAGVALITRTSLHQMANGPAVTVLLDVDGELIRAEPADPAAPAAESADNLAYIGQTSGSTGSPKLVGLSHRSLTSCYDGWAAALDLEGRIRSHLQVAGLAFDVHIGDLCRALLSGARLVLCPTEVALDPAQLHALLHDQHIDAVLLTPSVLRLLLPWLERTGNTLARLRQFAVGGENWTADEYRRLRTLVGPHTRILNFYGLAEACVDSLYCDLGMQPPGPDGIPLGEPFPGVGAYVLDGGLRPTPVGEVGELFLSGPGLAAGYYRSPADTAARFLEHPAGPAGTRLFRTGDLVRRLPGDVLVYYGREDDQVKVRGARVQLSEVEATLARCPGVESAAAALRDRAGEQVLVGYVIPSGEGAGLAAAARDYAASHLPPAMVPSVIVPCASFPLTMSGKVDRRKLPAPGSDRIDQPEGPWTTAAQAVVARHWTVLLGSAPSSATEDFFHAGANSLTAARLALGLADELGRDVTAGMVFASPTVGGLAHAIDSLGGPASPIAADPGLLSAPITPDQRRLWLLHRLRPRDAAYHVPMLIELRGPVCVGALQQSLDMLAARHDSLRTVFRPGPAGLTAQVQPAGRLLLEQAELPGQDMGERRAAAQRVLADRTTAPFDVSAGPLCRALLCSLNAEHHLLLIVAHHLVLDGWSVRILLRDLGSIYSALVTGSAVPPAPASVRMVDIASRLSDKRHAGASLRYWQRQLADPPPPLRLPMQSRPQAADASPAADNAGRAARHRRWVDAETTAAMRHLGRAHRTTGFAVLLATVVALLHRWTGQEDLVIGAPFGHRDGAGTEHLVGMLVSTHALRLATSGEMPFDELVARARHAMVGAIAHRTTPFDVIVHELGLSGGEPLFRVWLNLLGPSSEAPAMAGLQTELAEPPLPGAVFDLSLYVTEDRRRLRLDLVHNTDAIDTRCAAEFLEQFVLLLAAGCAAPATAISRHRLQTAAGTRVLPRPQDDLLATRPATPALLDRLGAAAAGSAARTALCGPDGGKLSYRELYEAVSDVAERVKLAGAAEGDVVPILARRHPELVATLIGVLAAGAGFAVVDQDQPVSRIASMIEVLAPRVGISLAGPVPRELEPLCGRWLRDMLRTAGGPASRGVSLGPADGQRLAYVAFTSGTTGLPRAVRGGTEPLAHFLSWYVAEFRITAADRFAMLSGLGYDPLLRDILTPLWVGGTLWIPPSSVLRVPRDLLTWLAANRITVAHLTPQLARLISLAPAGLAAPDLRLLCIGGDALYDEDLRGAARWAPGARIVNVYGATETPQIVAYHPVSGPDLVAPGRPVPIGRAAPGSQLLVMNDHGMAGLCEIGRIVIRGPHLAAGYLSGVGGFQPDGVAGHRRFDTGDLGRYLPDGTVELLGRSDGQLKIRGFRVDLAEIVGRLREHPSVLDCAVVARRGADGEQQLICYVVADPDQPGPVGTESVRRWLRSCLPEHMLPAEVHPLPAIPLTVTGKLDRMALAASVPPAPAAPAAPAAAPGLGARQREIEYVLAEAWREVAGTAPADHERNFFDLGGSSMLMVRMHSVLEQRLAMEVPITALFEYPTVRQLAAYLMNAGRPDTKRPVAAAAQSSHDLRARRLAARGAAEFPRP